MSIVDRATNVSLRPQAEWPLIAAEPASLAGIFTGYVAPLAAIGPVALVIGLSIVGVGIPFVGTYRAPLAASIAQAALTFVLIVVGVGVMSAIAGVLAPRFGGRRDPVAALKLVGYAYTPAFIAGVLGLFPPLSFLEIFAAAWTLYVFYKGAPLLSLSAPGRALPYTAAWLACGIALGVVAMLVGGAVGFTTGAFAGHRGLADAGDAQGSATVAGVLGSAMGGGASNADSAKKMVDAIATAGADSEKAQAAGDTSGQAQAAMNALNAMVRGGKSAVKPIAREQLKTLLPDSTGGLARTASEGSSGTFAGIAGSSATATYGGGNGSGSIEVGVADLGNMGGIAAIASIGTTFRPKPKAMPDMRKMSR